MGYASDRTSSAQLVVRRISQQPTYREKALALVEMHRDEGITFHDAVGALRDERGSMEWAQLRLGVLGGVPQLDAPESRARALRLRREIERGARTLRVEDIARALRESNDHFGRARLLLRMQIDEEARPNL